jgi:hypothetical protein
MIVDGGWKALTLRWGMKSPVGGISKRRKGRVGGMSGSPVEGIAVARHEYPTGS